MCKVICAFILYDRDWQALASRLISEIMGFDIKHNKATVHIDIGIVH